MILCGGETESTFDVDAIKSVFFSGIFPESNHRWMVTSNFVRTLRKHQVQILLHRVFRILHQARPAKKIMQHGKH